MHLPAAAVASPVLATGISALLAAAPLLPVLLASPATLRLPHLTAALVAPLAHALLHAHAHALLLHPLLHAAPRLLLHAAAHLVAAGAAPSPLLHAAHLVAAPLLLSSSHLHLGELGLGPAAAHASTHLPVAAAAALLVEVTSLVVASAVAAA